VGADDPGEPKEDILTICEGGFGRPSSPRNAARPGDRQWTQGNIRFSGAMGIDATRPFIHKDAFERARYNVEVVDLAKSTRRSRSGRQRQGNATTPSSWRSAGSDGRHRRGGGGEERRHGLRIFTEQIRREQQSGRLVSRAAGARRRGEQWGLDVVWLAEMLVNPARSCCRRLCWWRAGSSREPSACGWNGGAALAAEPPAPCRR